jgi:hypothetical protein
MAIRKFIEEIGEKVLPPRGSHFNVGTRQQPTGAFDESSEAIRRYLLSRHDYTAPSDLVVFFDAASDVVIIGGTVRDERTREAIVEAAGNIHGVERVDDRMVTSVCLRGSRSG